MKAIQWKQPLHTLFAFFCALGLSSQPLAFAVDSSWTNTIGGNWNDPNWQNGVPGPTTNAFITNSLVAASSFTITNNVTSNTIANLTIINLGAGTNTLLDTGNGLNPTGDVVLGRNSLLLLNGGSATVGGSMVISNLGRVVITNNSLLQIGASASSSLMSTGRVVLGSGGTLAAGTITNTGVITTFGAGGGTAVITGSVLNLTGTTTLGARGINAGGNPTDAALSLVGAQPFLNSVNHGSIGISSNGTLNIGGLTAAASTASFTNRGTIAFYGGVAGTINALNAGTLVNEGFLDLSPANGVAGATNYVNADVVNYGAITNNSAGVGTRIFRSLTNFGTYSLGALAPSSSTIIQQGSFLNDGTLNAIAQTTFVVTNGGFINGTNGSFTMGRSTVRANFFTQDGLLAITNTGNGVALLAHDGTPLSFTNNGTMTWNNSNGNDGFQTLQAGTICNSGVFNLYGGSNAVNGLSTSRITYMGSGANGNLSNLASGVVTALSNALASFDAGLVNQGTINIESNSVFSTGHSGVGASSSATPTSFNFRGGTRGWTNDGMINMDVGSSLAVASMLNSSTAVLSGAGHIGPVLFQTITNSPGGTATQFVQNVTVANIANAGTIAPNGSLNAGTITNLSGGRIIGSGVIQSINTTNFYSGLAFVNSNIYTGARIFNTNGATILASGGTLVLSNGFVNNSNAGTIGATNGILQLGDGTLALTNNGTISVDSGGLNIGFMRNNGTIEIINSSVTFSNSVVNAGRYISDPSTNTFMSDITITPSGTLEGGPGNLFDFKANLLINSTNTMQFNLVLSTVSFSGGGAHTNAITGLDFDNSPAFGESHGFTATNFAYGALRLGASDDLYLIDGDGNTANSNGLYISVLDIGGTTNDLERLHSPFNIYYRNGLAENAYLGGLTYELDQGGFLIPVPEPSTILLLSCGALVIVARRRTDA